MVLIKPAKANMLTGDPLLDSLSARCVPKETPVPGHSLLMEWICAEPLTLHMPQALEDKLGFGFYFRAYTKTSAKPRFIGLLGAVAKMSSCSVAFQRLLQPERPGISLGLSHREQSSIGKQKIRETCCARGFQPINLPSIVKMPQSSCHTQSFLSTRATQIRTH